MRHIAESSLSLLAEPHLKRLRKNGFRAILPGIESWYDLGNKSKTRRTGMDKVKQVADHVNMILRYIPYIQTNFVLGLDGDKGRSRSSSPRRSSTWPRGRSRPTRCCPRSGARRRSTSSTSGPDECSRSPSIS